MRHVEITLENMLEVSLNSVERVKNFVNVTGKHDVDIFITDGKYIIDAKSIMGIFSLNLAKPLYIYTEPDNIKNNTKLVNSLTEFITDIQ